MLIPSTVFGPEDDRTLWHYTDAAGFVGILQSQQIWASSLIFLNDSTEIYHVYNLLRQFVLNTNYGDMERLLVDLAVDRAGGKNNPLSSIQQARWFGASFSVGIDDLDQWRAYAPNNGYNIGVSPKMLTELAGTQGFSLERVQYIENPNVDVIKTLLRPYLDECEALNLDYQSTSKLKGKWPWHDQPELSALVENLIGQIAVIAPLVKSSYYSSEEEWRLVLRDKSKVKSIKVRQSLTGLVPYIPIDMSVDNELHLRAVVTGPSPRQELNLAAALFLATKDNRVDCPTFLQSEAPHRAW